MTRAYIAMLCAILSAGCIVVEVGGPIVKTNADSVAGSRVPLETVDLDQFLASGADFTLFLVLHQGTMSLAEARTKMKLTKGLWMQLRPEVSVEFGRK